MKRILTAMIFVALATPAAAGWNLIDSTKKFNELVRGKSFIHAETKAWFQFAPNGKLAGAARGEKLTGKWRFNGQQACYSRKLGSEKLPGDCVTIWVDGNKLVTKRKSDGRRVEYVVAK